MKTPHDLRAALAQLGVDADYRPLADSSESLPDVAEGLTVQGAAASLLAAIAVFVGGASDDMAEPARQGNQLIFADAPADFDVLAPGGEVHRVGDVLIVTVADETPCVGLVRGDRIEVITANGRLGVAERVGAAVGTGAEAASLPSLDGLLDGLAAPNWLGDAPVADAGAVWPTVAWAGAVYQHATPTDTAAAAQAILAGGDNPTAVKGRAWASSLSAAAVQQVCDALVTELDALAAQLEAVGCDHAILAGEADGERPFADDTTRRAQLGEAAERRDTIAGVLGLLRERGDAPNLGGQLERVDRLGRVAVLGEDDLASVPTGRRYDMASAAPMAWWGALA